MELMDYVEFVKHFKRYTPADELPSFDQDCFGIFPITNRGIQIWMLLTPYRNSDSVFTAWLPCRDPSWGPPVRIDLVLWHNNHYRYPSMSEFPTEKPLQFRQVYLQYQDALDHDMTFEIDDGLFTENGFTCTDVYPSKFTGNIVTVTSANPLHVRTYSERQGNGHFAVVFGQSFNRDWIYCINDPSSQFSSVDEGKLLVMGPKRAHSMADAPSQNDDCDRVWVYHSQLPGSTWIVRTSRVVWERLRIGVRMEVFLDSRFRDGLDEWKIFDIEVSNFLVLPMDHCDYA